MQHYFLKRFLLLFPTLAGVSLLFFLLKQTTSTDPALVVGAGLQNLSPAARTYLLQQKAREDGIHLPLFYLTLTTQAQPDTLFKIFPLSTRQRLGALAAATGQWPLVTAYEEKYRQLAEHLPDSLEGVQQLRVVVADFEKDYTLADIQKHRAELTPLIEACRHTADSAAQALATAADRFYMAIDALESQKMPWKNNLPAVHWHGTENQYHRWLTGFFSGNMGLSLGTRQFVSEALYLPLQLTLLINGISLLLTLAIAIPTGIVLAGNAGRKREKVLRILLLSFYTVPVFLLGSLFIVFLATPGTGLGILPGIGVSQFIQGKDDFWTWTAANVSRLILPVATLTLHSLAMFALQMKGALLEIFRQPFMQTARAKGLPEQYVFWKHAFPNALSPLVSLLVTTFPSVITGSLVIDYLFALPGMGSKTQEAFMNGDVPLITAILMIIALFTVVSQFLGDILYKKMDPRVQY